MAKTWSITGPAKTAVKDAKPAEIMFSITNILAEPVSGLVRILPQAPLTSSSFKPPPDSNLSFAANETKAYTFQFDPIGLQPGTYMYEFTVAPPANPNDPMADRITSSAEVAQQKPKPKWWIYALIAGVLVIGGALVYLFLGRGVEIPDVAGKTMEDATNKLTEAGFTVKAEAVERDRPNGEVVGTEPEIGSKQNEGSRVTLQVATGPAIPHIDGPAADGQASLEALGFTVTTVEQAHASIPAGSVISTDPPEGERAGLGQPITLVVSTGPAGPTTVSVPNVVGMTLSQATDALATRQLGTFSQCQEIAIGDGKVFNQIPEPGRLVDVGSDVSVQILATNCSVFPVDWIWWEEIAVDLDSIDFDIGF